VAKQLKLRGYNKLLHFGGEIYPINVPWLWRCFSATGTVFRKLPLAEPNNWHSFSLSSRHEDQAAAGANRLIIFAASGPVSGSQDGCRTPAAIS